MNAFKNVLVLLLSTCLVSAQTVKFSSSHVSETNELNSKFYKYTIVKLSTEELLQKVSRNSTVSNITLTGEGIETELTLVEYDLFHKNFIRIEGIDDNKRIITSDRSGIRTFKVFQKSKPNQYSALTISPNFIYGYFDNHGERVFIEPLSYYEKSAGYNQFVIYKESEIIPNKNIVCAADEIENNHSLVTNENSNSQRAGCITVDVALAADLTIHDNKGGVGNSEAFMIGVLNNVQTNYDDEFSVAIEFSVSGLFVATTAAGDPWNGISNIHTHLDKHRSWANSGGYGGASFGVATAWSRKYTSGAIGVAWLGAICSGLRYNVCSDFGGSAGLLRVLQAHELGHNFNCSHDGAGSGFIMAPAVNGSTTWSSASITAINNFVPNLGCVGICNGGEPPTAEFSGSPLSFCPNQVVNFNDMSFGFPNKWTWSFPGGTPATSTQQHPSIIYKNSGIYDVTLLVSNAFGSNTVKKQMYIKVLPSVTNSFTAYTIGNKLITSNSSSDVDTYLWKFGNGATSNEEEPIYIYPKDGNYTVEFCGTNSCGTICKTVKVIVVTPVIAAFKTEEQSTGCATVIVKYRNQSSSNATSFNWTFPGGTPSSSTEKEPLVVYSDRGKYEVTLRASNSKYDSTITLKEFITVETKPNSDFDYKLDGHNKIIFNNLTSESILNVKNKYVWKFDDGLTSSELNPVHEYKSPGKYNVCLISENSCGTNISCKEVEVPYALIPSFEPSHNNVCLPFEIEYTNKSFGALSYRWIFEGGSPSVSTEESPKIFYSKSGRYDVSLELINGLDSIKLSKKQLIVIKSPVQCPERKGKTNKLTLVESEEQEIVSERSRIDSKDLVLIYPNPSEEIFALNCQNCNELKNIKILNLQGFPIEYSIKDRNRNQILIELDNYYTGIHYVIFTYKKELQVQRVVFSN
ncbi:MAG: PKD domain-containing protein [Saprospiraceae bacterium]|nr:PKD domain-containing protein [Saprospiraceae bacterium]